MITWLERHIRPGWAGWAGLVTSSALMALMLTVRAPWLLAVLGWLGLLYGAIFWLWLFTMLEDWPS